MKTYKGFVIHELSRCDMEKEQYNFCNNSVCDTYFCHECLYSISNKEEFDEWLLIEDRTRKLERILK